MCGGLLVLILRLGLVSWVVNFLPWVVNQRLTTDCNEQITADRVPVTGKRYTTFEVTIHRPQPVVEVEILRWGNCTCTLGPLSVHVGPLLTVVPPR